MTAQLRSSMLPMFPLGCDPLIRAPQPKLELSPGVTWAVPPTLKGPTRPPAHHPPRPNHQAPPSLVRAPPPRAVRGAVGR